LLGRVILSDVHQPPVTDHHTGTILHCAAGESYSEGTCLQSWQRFKQANDWSSIRVWQTSAVSKRATYAKVEKLLVAAIPIL
jgi:hypothetical protein